MVEMSESNNSDLMDSKADRLLRPGFLLAVFLFAYNNIVNFLPPSIHVPIYVWLNLGVLVLVWILCRRYLHLTFSDMGIAKQNLGKSILYGVGLSALVVLPFMVLLWILPGVGFEPRTPRLETIARDIFWWRILVRIPIGTAFFEEMLFRGIFYGYLMKKMSHAKTIWISSLFFGFWHIVPAYRVVSQDLQLTSPPLFIGVWLLLLLGSVVGGILFAWIRYRTRNIAGSVLAHALINVLSLIGANTVWQ
jgi:membrane protease YdiL (CAAX protease family)